MPQRPGAATKAIADMAMGSGAIVFDGAAHVGNDVAAAGRKLPVPAPTLSRFSLASSASGGSTWPNAPATP